jgi:hypothetical protein
MFSRAWKGEAVNKYTLIFQIFTNQLRYLSHQVFIFKEMFENNDIPFFMLRLAFQERINPSTRDIYNPIFTAQR